MDTAYLDIDKEAFDKTKAGAEKAGTSAVGSDKSFLYEQLDWALDKDACEFTESGELYLFGDISEGTKRLGCLSCTIKLDFDLVTGIIEHYVKKVNKVKTILEATK